jgi:hypothetical protein
MQIIDGTLFSFDTSKIKLRELILEHFEAENIQEIIEKNKNEIIYKRLYELQKNSKFLVFFSSLLTQLSINLEESEFFYQSIPSFRIHRVKGVSVNYHNDVMYGHGEKVINVWLPLNDTNKKNALHISNIDTSKKLLRKIKDEKLSLTQTNDLVRSYCAPQLVRYGQIMLFNTMTMHGTELNTSKEHRLSFDFRILPLNGDSGSKVLNDFFKSYSPEVAKPREKIPCTYYLNKNNPLLKNCSHFVQREIINMYANENSLTLEGREESEIYDFNHYPVIFHYLNDNKTNDIVMASILCLPSDLKLRTEVLSSARKNNVNLHFCMENKVSNNFSIDDANSYYELLLKAEKFL